MNMNQELVDAAIQLLEHRWPATEHGVAAAVYLENGQILTSVGFDNVNAAANLCAETGALCQAFTMNLRVTASVCVSRQPDRDATTILAPCGMCQERLAVWGPDVQVGIPGTGAAAWAVRTLRQVNPYYWATAFVTDGDWPSTADHST